MSVVKGEIVIVLTIKTNYEEGIPSNDRDIQADEPQVDWSIDCDNESFQREVLDDLTDSGDPLDEWICNHVIEENW